MNTSKGCWRARSSVFDRSHPRCYHKPNLLLRWNHASTDHRRQLENEQDDHRGCGPGAVYPRGLNEVKAADRVLCPPFTALATVSELLQATEIGLGAQDMYWQDKGAYTGEISPLMLKEMCQYVILGHSERRAYFGETDEAVNRKVRAALTHGLTPIVCVGETEAQYDAGQTNAVVGGQVRGCLAGLTAEQVAAW